MHERIREEITKSKLNNRVFCLRGLYQRGKQTIQQIRKNILISSSSMTYIIDSLEQRGLLVLIFLINYLEFEIKIFKGDLQC
ncbi:MarR family transcriptional regulator [Bacillus atrophaeus]|uniref:MarR family transcriptional regulator n=1 Tax=Bacillus atrophaeus TaxID=1452 RepID=UPI002DBAD32B|nr:MarR family transcriptional regulator [Bacillus atrophaeus]MEC2306847.1 MarR family transcriptional regulator [Bacillus atrophaeus]